MPNSAPPDSYWRSHRDRVGARLVPTVTVNVWSTFKLPSLAVTVIVDEPAATPLMLTVDPDTLTVALLVALELAL